MNKWKKSKVKDSFRGSSYNRNKGQRSENYNGLQKKQRQLLENESQSVTHGKIFQSKFNRNYINKE